MVHIGDGNGEAMAVFPTKGDVTAYVRGPGDVPWELKAQNWVQDIRGSGRMWGQVAAARIKELGLERGTIGVCGLAGVCRAPEGVVAYNTMKNLMDDLPGATFVNGTELMMSVRITKSPEEVAFLEKATELAEAEIEAIAASARPGMREYEVYAAAVYAALSRGGEYPYMFRWRASHAPETHGWSPTHRVLEPGDVIITEQDAKWGGYEAQAPHGIQVGGEPRAIYLETFEVSRAAFEAMMAVMKPGATVGDVVRAYATTVEQAGFAPGVVPFVGRGAGEDEPTARMSDPPEALARPLQVGNVVTLQPAVSTPDHTFEMVVGDTVVVTEDGCRRLGKRELSPIITEG
jgi:Xaa-Pro dipeptidase